MDNQSLVFIPSDPFPTRFERQKIKKNSEDQILIIKKRDRLGMALEDYFANNVMIPELCKKYKISHWYIGRYISKMIPLKLSEETVVIIKESTI